MKFTIDILLTIIFFIFYTYQFYYAALTLLYKPILYKADKKHKYAVLICARNEQNVIAGLIKSMKRQKYPSDLLDIIVCADNCTDDTANTARSSGAIVYERFNLNQVGKGYALNFLFNKIKEDFGIRHYDGYFIFDADNIAAPDFVDKMNDMFDNGFKIVTGYRASKNFSDSWISASQSLYFMRESRFLNNARMICGHGCMASGTGYLISSEIIEKHDGWNFFTLCEDLEFTVVSALEGYKIGYCDSAEFYDEQPIFFSQSIKQRLRWVKGGLTVFAKYGLRLLKRYFETGDFTYFDIFVSVSPVLMVTVLGLFTNPIFFIASFCAMMLTYGILTYITEKNRIKCNPFLKAIYLATFPFFMIMTLPISYAALFRDIEWTPIAHGDKAKIKPKSSLNLKKSQSKKVKTRKDVIR